jgi:TolA-binding protein
LPSPEAAPPRPAPSLEELAKVEPPPYTAVVLRGAGDKPRETFHKAMDNYARGDYAHAIPGLRSAVKASPRTPRFSFYLGACYLLTGETDLSIATLRRTASLGDLTYSEQSHFYLAKAYLKQKKVAEAENELRITTRLGGERKAEAQEILRRLSK